MAKQISSISTVLICGLVLIAIAAIATSALLRSTFVDYRETARASNLTNEVFEDIFETRLAALKWRSDPNAESREEVEANIQEVVDAPLGSLDLGDLGLDAASFAQSISQVMLEYGDHFERLVKARERYDVAESAATEAGLSARRAITGIMETAFASGDTEATYFAGTAQLSLMLGRYYLERFRRTAESRDLDRSILEMTQARELLDQTRALDDARNVDLFETAESQMDVFVESRDSLSTALNERIAAEAAMDRIGPQVILELENVLDRVFARQDTLGPRGQATSLWAVVFVLVFATVVTALG